MTITEAISVLDKECLPAPNDIPEAILFFISRHTPLINIDLLIRDECKQNVLLSWRNDVMFNIGWSIPGGIIRCKETLKDRIIKTAQNEINKNIKRYINFNYIEIPIYIHEFINPNQQIRCHHISFIYECFVSNNIIINENIKEGMSGYLKWFHSCPNDLIKIHEVYKKFF